MNITINKKFTYDDVLIKPKFSNILSRKNVDIKTKLTKNITLSLPIISSNMDTITESEMAIEMAKAGGLGIIHRYCSIDEQVNMIKKVKRYTNFIIDNPFTVDINERLQIVYKLMKNKNVGSILVANGSGRYEGIITKRDFLFVDYQQIIKDSALVKNYMTPLDKTIYINNNEINNIDFIKNKFKSFKIEQMPILDSSGFIKGLITSKDIFLRENYKYNLNSNMQLVVGAAVGVKGDYLERTKKLINVGCDIICIDVAHGHHKLCGDAVSEIRRLYPNIGIIAGNVCTPEGVTYLAKLGADCIKVGIGPGSICITRKQTGCGYPQLSAIMECSVAAREHNVSIIADGGHNGTIGNIFKGLVCGSSASMLGGMISGTKETPGNIIIKNGKQLKMIRGMAGRISNLKKSYRSGEKIDLEGMTPEGVEGYVEYKGPVSKVLNQISGGIRSGFSYIGCHNIEELRNSNIELIEISSNALKISGSHGIKEV